MLCVKSALFLSAQTPAFAIEIGNEHEVQVSCQLDTSIDFLLLLCFNFLSNNAILLLSRPRALRRCINSRRTRNSLHLPILMLMSMSMIMPSLPTSSNPQPLIHSHKRHKPNHNRNPKQQIPIWLHQHKPHMLRRVLPKEYLRQQMEQRITQ